MKPAKPLTAGAAAALIASHLADCRKQEKHYGRWDLELHYMPTAKELLALDPASQAMVAVALFRALPKAGHEALRWLGRLSGALLRRELPLTDDDVVTLLECTTDASVPSHASVDFDRFVLQLVARRRSPPTAKMKTAIQRIATRRGDDKNNYKRVTPRSRKVVEACAKLIRSKA